jgi:hypothetical protein
MPEVKLRLRSRGVIVPIVRFVRLHLESPCGSDAPSRFLDANLAGVYVYAVKGDLVYKSMPRDTTVT